MNNFPYIDILILAMVAIFIINRLKNTLGKKTGNENDLADKYSQGRSRYKESKPDKVVVAGGTGKKSLYNVSHWAWGGELIKPEPITGFVEVPFDIRNVQNFVIL